MKCSKNKIKDNYTVTTDNVTESQIKKAWDIINDIIPQLKIGGDFKIINIKLLNLYTTIPRSMKKVQDFLIRTLIDKSGVLEARVLLDNEQSLLSTLESQIKIDKASNGDIKDGKNILDDMDISIEVETDNKQLKYIHKILGDNSKYAKNIYKVTDFKTQSRFDKFIDKTKNKKTQLLWHGSRNENWMGILQTGLMIRPSNAIITGAMFGNGMYFANRSRKALGYSSLKGSYWTSGGSNSGFISLFDVHVGVSKNISRWDSTCKQLHKVFKKSSWDSIFAHAGTSLKNDEIIVYKTEQTTIKYIIEITK